MAQATSADITTGAEFFSQVAPRTVLPKASREFQRLLADCEKNLDSTNREMLTRAFLVASWAHKNDKRKSGEPYIFHPLAVASILATDVHFDDYCVAAGLLHDVVEDNSEVTVQMIEDWFDGTLAAIVDGVTKIEHEFESREVRQAENFRKLLLSMASDTRIILVKFADRVHNLRTIDSLAPQKQLKIAHETLDLFTPLAHRFGLNSVKSELEDLSLKVTDSKAFYTISRGLNAKKREREQFIQAFMKPIALQLKESGFDFDISGRPKHIYSIYRKMRKQGKGLDEIFDLFAIRIILKSTGRQGKEDCWRVYSIVTDSYRPIPERFRDFVSVPKSNGYQSLHTTVIGPSGKPVEVQIRTQEMHEVAERGFAAHWKYKEGEDGHAEGYSWIRDLLENPDSEKATEFVDEFRRDLSDKEVYVFTPKGDLHTLPRGATPVDFAYHIHSEVGFHCNGAMVGGRVVPLSYRLNSGDQVEILTSKNKTPNPDWMKFVVTQKARSRIRHWINEKNRAAVQKGREIWEKRAKKSKLEVDEQDLHRFASRLKFPNISQMFLEIGEGLFDVKELVQLIRKGPAEVEKEGLSEDRMQTMHENFLNEAQATGSPALLIHGESFSDMATTYANCCNPIPGDHVFGYMSRNGGLTIHRSSCRNAEDLLRQTDRIMAVEWSRQKDISFIAGLRLVGEDRVGIASDLTETISRGMKTNIRSLVVDGNDGIFEGRVVVDVNDLAHLSRLMQRLKKIDGIYGVYRFEE